VNRRKQAKRRRLKKERPSDRCAVLAISIPGRAHPRRSPVVLWFRNDQMRALQLALDGQIGATKRQRRIDTILELGLLRVLKQEGGVNG
jgi:hypothetical protein